MKKIQMVLITLSIFIAIGCQATTGTIENTQQNTQTQIPVLNSLPTKLPENFPPDIQISLRHDGGMSPEGDSIEIQKNEGKFTQFDGSRTTTKTYEITDDELKNLYKILRDNALDQIRTYTEEVYDRGGTEIQLILGKDVYNVGDDGMSFININDLEHYQNIIKAIEDLNSKKLSENAK